MHTIVAYLKGERDPSARVIGRLADALGLHPGEMFVRVTDDNTADNNGADTLMTNGRET